MECKFLDHKEQWTTENDAVAAAWEYIEAENFRVLKKAGWKISARPYLGGWALYLVRRALDAR